MKILATAIGIGPLVMIGTLPEASQSGHPREGASVRLVTDRDSTADRETYTQKAHDDMQEWQPNLRAFDEKVQAKAVQAHTSTMDDLTKAWTQAEAASRRLETASSEDWETPRPPSRKHPTGLIWRGAKVTPGTNSGATSLAVDSF
jgi:hypothetical protein